MTSELREWGNTQSWYHIDPLRAITFATYMIEQGWWFDYEMTKIGEDMCHAVTFSRSVETEDIEGGWEGWQQVPQ